MNNNGIITTIENEIHCNNVYNKEECEKNKNCEWTLDDYNYQYICNNKNKNILKNIINLDEVIIRYYKSRTKYNFIILTIILILLMIIYIIAISSKIN